MRHLKTTGVSLNAIVISALTDDDTIEDARSAGASFVAKPVDFELLRRLVRA